MQDAEPTSSTGNRGVCCTQWDGPGSDFAIAVILETKPDPATSNET